MTVDCSDSQMYGKVALALVIALLREMHHEGLMDEARFKRMLVAAGGLARALLHLRRDFEPITDETSQEIDFEALLKDMTLSRAWNREEELERFMDEIERSFFRSVRDADSA